MFSSFHVQYLIHCVLFQYCIVRLLCVNKNLLLTYLCWLRGSAVEHRSLAVELSLCCARPLADG